jgi:hypothetical protein
MPSGKSKKTGSGSSRHKPQKRQVRGKFVERHIDQIFGDFVQKPEEVHDGKHGPLGSTNRCVPGHARERRYVSGMWHCSGPAFHVQSLLCYCSCPVFPNGWHYMVHGTSRSTRLCATTCGRVRPSQRTAPQLEGLKRSSQHLCKMRGKLLHVSFRWTPKMC